MTNRKKEFPIKSFIIYGLYGYKTLKFKTKGKTTVVVSENGSGKTTVLNSLNNIINGNIASLIVMDFSHIEMEVLFENRIHKYTIKKNELSSQYNINIKEIFNITDYDFYDKYTDHDILNVITKNSSKIDDFDFDDEILFDFYQSVEEPKNIFFNKLKTIKEMFFDIKNEEKTESIKNILKIEEIFRDFDCIYLPTYRRVEKSFSKEKVVKRERLLPSRYVQSKRKYNNIIYGLNDVEQILAEMSYEIERKSNLGYRELSANILQDLLDNQKLNIRKGKLPDLNNLKRFLNRVRNKSFLEHNSEMMGKLESFYNIDKKKHLDDKIDNNQYLYYFLSRLNTVINETKELELKIENFVNECNKYLECSGDAKRILFEPNTLKVEVRDSYTEKKINLNDLSSGEKQVISFMSILYLQDNKDKILLIDEPELSLSLEWQQKILPDINKSENVAQVIAITHSPFIFQNELDKNATSLKILKDKL